MFVFAIADDKTCYYVPTRALHTSPLPVFVGYSNGASVQIADAVEDFLRWPRFSGYMYEPVLPLGGSGQLKT